MLFGIENTLLTVDLSPTPWTHGEAVQVSLVYLYLDRVWMDHRILSVYFSSWPPQSQDVEDILFTLYVAPWFALTARPPSSPTSSDQSDVEQWSRSSQQPASFPCCFTSGRVVRRPDRTIFSCSQLPKPLDIFAVCASRHHRGSQ